MPLNKYIPFLSAELISYRSCNSIAKPQHGVYLAKIIQTNNASKNAGRSMEKFLRRMHLDEATHSTSQYVNMVCRSKSSNEVGSLRNGAQLMFLLA